MKQSLIWISVLFLAGSAYYALIWYPKDLEKSFNQAREAYYLMGSSDAQMMTRQSIITNMKQGECKVSTSSKKFYLEIK